jgi:hypothetical protein
VPASAIPARLPFELVLDVPADAIGLELDIRIKRQPAKRNGDYSPLKVKATV